MYRATIVYRIAGNFGEVYNLANSVKITKLKAYQFRLMYAHYMALRIQIAKFKFRQYQLRVNLPNLMLAKVTHYTV